MPRSVYGHDYKSLSQAGRILLIGIVAAIIVFAFVWTTYDPQTFRRLNGVLPEVVKIQRAPEPQLIDAKSRGGLDNKRPPR